MTNKELNTALYKKMFAEQEKYRDHLITLSPEDILANSYEYTLREDIILSLESNDLTNKECEALLNLTNPLEDIFRRFEKVETDHMEFVWYTIEGLADDIIRKGAKS